MAVKVSSLTVTSQIPIICFHSKCGHFWFVSMKLSEIVGFLCVDCHSSHKTNFKERMKDANAAITLLEKWPENFQALNGIRTHDLSVTGAISKSWFFFMLVQLTFLLRFFNKKQIVQISLHLTFNMGFDKTLTPSQLTPYWPPLLTPLLTPLKIIEKKVQSVVQVHKYHVPWSSKSGGRVLKFGLTSMFFP